MEKIISIQKPTGEHDKLLPCPFCGHEEIMYCEREHITGKPEHGSRWFVMCGGCCATVDPGYAQNKYTVQAKWNRRNTP